MHAIGITNSRGKGYCKFAGDAVGNGGAFCDLFVAFYRHSGRITVFTGEIATISVAFYKGSVAFYKCAVAGNDALAEGNSPSVVLR